MRMLFALAATAGLAAAEPVWAEETPTFEIAIKNHKFEPATLEVPANKKVKLVVKN